MANSTHEHRKVEKTIFGESIEMIKWMILFKGKHRAGGCAWGRWIIQISYLHGILWNDLWVSKFNESQQFCYSIRPFISAASYFFNLFILFLSFFVADCFQRVVIEAMLPDDQVYRTVETNSVRQCQDYCSAEGDRCQAFSIGISQTGNGTCQLAKTPAPEGGRRPKGTIYDPSFDIYNRKKNCFPVNDNVIPTVGKDSLLFYSRFPTLIFWIEHAKTFLFSLLCQERPEPQPLTKHLRSKASQSVPQQPWWRAPLAARMTPTAYNRYHWATPISHRQCIRRVRRHPIRRCPARSTKRKNTHRKVQHMCRPPMNTPIRPNRIDIPHPPTNIHRGIDIQPVTMPMAWLAPVITHRRMNRGCNRIPLTRWAQRAMRWGVEAAVAAPTIIPIATIYPSKDPRRAHQWNRIAGHHIVMIGIHRIINTITSRSIRCTTTRCCTNTIIRCQTIDIHSRMVIGCRQPSTVWCIVDRPARIMAERRPCSAVAPVWRQAIRVECHIPIEIIWIGIVIEIDMEMVRWGANRRDQRVRRICSGQVNTGRTYFIYCKKIDDAEHI